MHKICNNMVLLSVVVRLAYNGYNSPIASYKWEGSECALYGVILSFIQA